MGTTSIEWTDTTWNPVRGCSRVSKGCLHCYAERQAARFSKPGQPFFGYATSTVVCPKCGGDGFAHGPGFGCTKCGSGKDRGSGEVGGPSSWTGLVELIPSKLDEPLQWRKPRRVFVNSMSDLFHEGLSDEAIAAIFGVMAACPQHTFQVLTKRPERMRAWFEWVAQGGIAFDYCMTVADNRVANGIPESPWQATASPWPLPNVWLGVSVENQATADERIPLLLQTPAALRFVSYEPALGPVDFRRAFGSEGPRQTYIEQLDWLIVGGESGPGARPCDLAWVRSARDQCRAAGVPFFFKQAGARPFSSGPLSDWTTRLAGTAPTGNGLEERMFMRPRDAKGGDPTEWPEDLRVREFPRREDMGRVEA